MNNRRKAYRGVGVARAEPRSRNRNIASVFEEQEARVSEREWTRESRQKMRPENGEGAGHSSHVEPRVFDPQCDGGITGAGMTCCPWESVSCVQ